jgi:hypothetical protein
MLLDNVGIALHGVTDQEKLITENKIKIFQLMTHSTKDLGIIWTPDMISELRKRYPGSLLYAHSVFKVVVGRPFSTVIFREHYTYACRHKFAGYIIHLPAKMDPDLCIEGIGKMLSSASRFLAERHVEPITVYLEHVPSEYYCGHLDEFISKLTPEIFQIPIGICIDTCHLYVSGISLDSRIKAKKYLDKIDFPFIIHLNDSANSIGSFIDRHAELGNLIWKNDQSGLKYILELPNVKIIELSDSASSIDFIINNILSQ